MNYYNELDPFCANWLYNLIQQNLIPPGDIDTRDIRDVKPADLGGYTQLHFFAGIGGWALSLRLAGWPDEQPVWTGSCPCQPFSAAGRRKGFADERHLWPYWFKLIKACRPETIFGEQVASAKDWLYKVKFDLEHVSMTDDGREALYGLQTSKSLAGFSYLSWPWIIRAAALVQGLPAPVRNEVAEFIKRISQGSESEEAREGRSVPSAMDIEKSSQVFDSGDQASKRARKHSVRSESLDNGDRRAHQEGVMRSDGIPSGFESAVWQKPIGAIVGPHRSEGGLCLQEYPGDVLGRECDAERLGRGSRASDYQSVGEEINGQPGTSGTIGSEPSHTVAGERLVRGDLEALDYAVGCCPVEAASAGADHLRDRYWFVAHDEHEGEGRRGIQRPGESSSAAGERPSDQSPGSGFNNNWRLADASGRRRSGSSEGESKFEGRTETFGAGNPSRDSQTQDGSDAQGRQAPAGNHERILGADGDRRPDGSSATRAEYMAHAASNGQRGERFAAPSGESQSETGGLRSVGNDSAVEQDPRVRWGEGRTEHELRSGRTTAAESSGAEHLEIAECGRRIEDGCTASSNSQTDGSRTANRIGTPSTNGMAHPDFPVGWIGDQQPAGQFAQQQQHSEARDLGHSDLARAQPHAATSTPRGSIGEPGSGDIEWVLGADGKARRVKSGVCLLVDGFPNRVGLLRGFGNAIDPRPAAAFIKASRQ